MSCAHDAVELFVTERISLTDAAICMNLINDVC